MSVAGRQAEKSIERYRAYRLKQAQELRKTAEVGDHLELELQSLVGAVGLDPVSNQPLVRYNKIMPDHATAWGFAISPIWGESVVLRSDRAGHLFLTLGSQIFPLDDAFVERGTVFVKISGRQDSVRFTDILLDFVGQQLDRVVEQSVIF